jgi:hypothetical protein
MPRETALLDALVPSLLFAFVAAGVAALLLDWIMTRYRWYRFIWYPALFRLAVFVCVFGVLGLGIY